MTFLSLFGKKIVDIFLIIFFLVLRQKKNMKEVNVSYGREKKKLQIPEDMTFFEFKNILIQTFEQSPFSEVTFTNLKEGLANDNSKVTQSDFTIDFNEVNPKYQSNNDLTFNDLVNQYNLVYNKNSEVNDTRIFFEVPIEYFDSKISELSFKEIMQNICFISQVSNETEDETIISDNFQIPFKYNDNDTRKNKDYEHQPIQGDKVQNQQLQNNYNKDIFGSIGNDTTKLPDNVPTKCNIVVVSTEGEYTVKMDTVIKGIDIRNILEAQVTKQKNSIANLYIRFNNNIVKVEDNEFYCMVNLKAIERDFGRKNQAAIQKDLDSLIGDERYFPKLIMTVSIVEKEKKIIFLFRGVEYLIPNDTNSSIESCLSYFAEKINDNKDNLNIYTNQRILLNPTSTLKIDYHDSPFIITQKTLLITEKRSEDNATNKVSNTTNQNQKMVLHSPQRQYVEKTPSIEYKMPDDILSFNQGLDLKYVLCEIGYIFYGEELDKNQNQFKWLTYAKQNQLNKADVIKALTKLAPDCPKSVIEKAASIHEPEQFQGYINKLNSLMKNQQQTYQVPMQQFEDIISNTDIRNTSSISNLLLIMNCSKREIIKNYVDQVSTEKGNE